MISGVMPVFVIHVGLLALVLLTVVGLGEFAKGTTVLPQVAQHAC